MQHALQLLHRHGSAKPGTPHGCAEQHSPYVVLRGAPRETKGGRLDIRSDGRFLISMWDAQSIGGSVVVLDSGSILVWGTCRGFLPGTHARSGDHACLQLYNPKTRDWRAVYQVSTSGSNPVLPHPDPAAASKRCACSMDAPSCAIRL